MSSQPPPFPSPPLVPQQEFIPYATPVAYQQAMMPVAGVWSEGNVLVCAKGAPLPMHCCVLCDQPADGAALLRKYSWHNPLLYLTLLAGVLIYVIVALAVAEKVQVYLPMCRRHRSKRTTSIALAFLLFFGAIAGFIGAGMMNAGWLVLVGLVALLASLIVGMVGSRTLTPKRIDRNYAWLKGASAAYLAALPGTYQAQ